MFHSFSLEDLHFDDLSKGRGGGQTVNLTVDGEAPPRIQTPRLDLLRGVSVAVWGGETKRSVELSFRATQVHDGFKEALALLHAKVLRAAADDAEEWFKRPLTQDQIASHHSPCLRSGEDGPTLRLNVPAKQVLDDGQPVRDLPDGYAAGRSVVAVIQPVAIWFFNSKFGLRWKVHELHFSKKPAAVKLCRFVDDE